ncbi:uncharacterized protein LOC110727485 [Chenopodium quinoa]|uniref:uncharacterized protein LOC110727485 n=1 Tax=Chenopodium quinoa TaxID=63459 RepID=UPI000B774E07|nr:uncharacterized protein LOC110727485 [Chenopodium quinoa]XP_021762741.1 uncharacterized protein LOC110727485 [Chenopodium quinoa]
MMTSSGSGAYRVGGSLSSSNLSPLAPPFKVDKFLLKPNSTNTSVNYPDVPVYGTCFDPTPGHFWNSSSSSNSGPNSVATESVVTNTNCSSSAHMYGYRDPQSSSSSASVYYGNTNSVPAYDPFSYEPFPTTKTDEAAKPYYPPYVSPPPQKDEYLGLGVGSGPSYDLLSAHLSGRGSAQVDHTQAMSGDGRYKSKWGLSWSGLNENDHGKWTDYTQGFVSKDLNSSKLSNNKSSLVDGSNKSQTFVDINVHPFASGSNSNNLFGDASNKTPNQGACGLHGQVSTAKDNCFDIFGGGYSLGSLGMNQLDCKLSSECSRTRTSAFASVTKESPHLQEPVLESITSFCGPQKANSSSPEDQFSQTGYYMFGRPSTTNTFPMTVSKLPYGGSSSLVQSTPSGANVDSMGIDSANQSNSAAGYNSYQMEPQIPVGSKRHSSIRIRRPVPSSTAASACQIRETADNRLDDKVVSEKRKFSPELPHELNLDGLNMEASNAEAVYSIEKHSGGSDGHNLAEDSPCWKGASSQFSPFGRSESVASDVFAKKIDRCRSLSSQDLQNKSFFYNASASKDFYSGKVNEATSLERPSALDSTSNGNEDIGTVKNPKSYCFDLNTGDGLQSADDCHASVMECGMMNKSNAVSDPKHSLAAQLNLKGDLSSARNVSATPPCEKSGKGTSAAAKSLSGLPSNIDINRSNSLPENEASVKSASEGSDSRIDVNVLLRTMMNLSEILRCYILNNQVEVAGIQSVAIKQIINNLNASMLTMAGQTNVLSSPDSYLQKDFPAGQMVNDAEAFAASMRLGGTTAEILGNVSVKDDRIPFGDAYMTEAVKKLLSENLEEEEIGQQKLLYRNLWLEAEASLCVMTAKARFLRMKTEMKRIHDGTKDLHRADELANEDKDSPLISECPKSTTTNHHNHIGFFHTTNLQVAGSHVSEHERSGSTKKETSFPSPCLSKPGASGDDSDDSLTASHANYVDTGVMARYQILRNRVGCLDSLNNESKQSSSEYKCPSSLYDSGNGLHTSGITTKESDLDTVFGGYQILKCRDGNSDYTNYEGEQSPGDENYLPGNSLSSPDDAFIDSQLSNSLGVTDENEASVMARFRIIQSRMNHSNSMINDSTPSTAVAEDRTEKMGGSQQDLNIKITSFGPYPELTEDEDVNILKIGVNGISDQALAPIVKNSVIFEGWYDNDCSSSADWEHISSRDV